MRRSARLIPAEVLGYIIAITVWGTLIDTVSATLPILPTLLKLLSAFYIIFLAVKLWKTANVQLDLNQPAIRPRELFVATLLNPKALLFASAIFPVAAWVNWSIYAVHSFSGSYCADCIILDFYWFKFEYPKSPVVKSA